MLPSRLEGKSRFRFLYEEGGSTRGVRSRKEVQELEVQEEQIAVE
jgi:hypothetical protein